MTGKATVALKSAIILAFAASGVLVTALLTSNVSIVPHAAIFAVPAFILGGVSGYWE